MPSCTTRRKIRIFNFRLMPFLLFGIVSGIFAVTRANAIISILILMCVAAIFAALLFVTDIKKGIVLLFAVAVLGGGMAASATHYKYIDSIGQNAENTSIVARVCGINYSFEEDTYSENIKKIYVDSIVADGVKYKGGAFLYNNSSELSLSIGDQIIINGDIQQLIFTTSDTYSLMLYNDKIYYKIEAETVQKSLTFAPTRAERIRSAIFVKLEQSLGARVAGFAYSMLFGDKAYLYPDDKSDYQLTGTAHVFAVSGLHIGVLAGVIILILKKLKSKNLTILIIVSACLLIYAWLSSFSPSVLRAGLMAFIALFAKALGMRNDNLSTVSLSGIILLILKPFWLFDISFLLSFSAVLGIILLYPPIARRLKKIKYLGNAIAINVAVNIGILPLNLLFFGSFSVLTLPANIIIIPIISFVYIMLLIHLFCSFLLPFLVIFGAFSKTLIQFSSDIVKGIAETKWAVAEISLPLSMFIPYYTCCVIASDYSLIARQYKHIAVAVAVIAYSIIFLAASAYN